MSDLKSQLRKRIAKDLTQAQGPTPERAAQARAAGERPFHGETPDGGIVLAYRARHPLDIYLKREAIESGEYEAARRWALDYETAYRIRGVTARYAEPMTGTGDGVAEKRYAAGKRLKDIRAMMGQRLHVFMIGVCVYGNSVKTTAKHHGARGRDDGVSWLRLGLADLRDYYGT